MHIDPFFLKGTDDGGFAHLAKYGVTLDRNVKKLSQGLNIKLYRQLCSRFGDETCGNIHTLPSQPFHSWANYVRFVTRTAELAK